MKNDGANIVTHHPVVSREAWLLAREDLLSKEKELTRRRDELNELRRALPWVQVTKKYVFDGARGEETLEELFDGCHSGNPEPPT